MARSGKTARELLVAAVAVVALLDCRQLAGITENAPEALSVTACGLPYGTNACASCAWTSCCAESMACDTDPVCTTYESCLGGCNGDEDCRSQCTLDHPVGTSTNVSALSACLASKCEAPCNLGCGALAGYIAEPRTMNANSCQTCIESTAAACTHARACGSSVECDTYWRCVLSCSTEDCRSTCSLDHPAGAALFTTFQADYAGGCAIPCAFGNYWGCVGHVDYPYPTSPSFVATFPVIDALSNQDVPGLDVSVCTDCPCGGEFPVIVSGRTDDNGIVALQVPQVGGPSGVAHEVCVDITAPDMSVRPTFAYFGYPVSEPVLTVKSDDAVNFAPETTTVDEFAAFQTQLMVTQNPAKGFVAPFVHDCFGSPSPDVEVTTDSASPGVSGPYFTYGPTTATSPAGILFFFNLPPGYVTLTATPLATHVVASRHAVNVAAGTNTIISMFPTP